MIFLLYCKKTIDANSEEVLPLADDSIATQLERVSNILVVDKIGFRILYFNLRVLLK